jgi:uncharacterized protein (DUF302 family)
MSNYTIGTTVTMPFTATVERVRTALAEEGFGVLTEIDVAATMKAKLGLDVSPQLILGACNPPLAHQALTIEPSVGVFLPCNVVVREVDTGHALVEALDPDSMVAASGSEALAPVAAQARARLTRAIDGLV